MTLKDKKIVLGITGGIAAYKALELTRLLVKRDAVVRPVMTRAATSFIQPLSFSTLARNPVGTGLFDSETPGSGTINHIELAEGADLVIIAPATANIIGKIASGIADDLLTTVVMATAAPVLIAPAMNHRMLDNPIVRANIEKLKKFGFCFVGPGEGELACGYEGRGRLAPIEDIVEAAVECLGTRDLAGEKVLVTAGTTREMIDPVRFLSNASSGQMGYELAKAAKRRGAEVVLVSGPTHLKAAHDITYVGVQRAEQMLDASMRHFPQSTIVIMAAAVADYRPTKSHAKKVKKEQTRITIELERTTDILKEMSRRKKKKQLLVGFALETEDILKNAKMKLKEKGIDIIVANSPAAIGEPVNEAIIIDRHGHEETLPKLGKDELADRILNHVLKLKG